MIEKTKKLSQIGGDYYMAAKCNMAFSIESWNRKRTWESKLVKSE